MLHSFTCENFYSFKDKTTVNFIVDAKAPKNNGYFNTKSKTRLSKVETIIGPNASGKTNLLKVLPFLKWLITDSFEKDPNAPLPIQPFIFWENKNKPIQLSVVFEINGKVYTYSFTLTTKKIISEQLKLTEFIKEKKSSKTIFSRTWNKQQNCYNFSGAKFGVPKKIINNFLRTNASLISGISRLNHKESCDIAKFWHHLETNVIEAGWIGDHLNDNPSKQLFNALNFYSDHKNLKKEAEKLLSRFDLSLFKLEIIKKETKEGVSLQARSIHKINNKMYPLNLNYESSGTKRLLVLLKTILSALTKGGIAVIDGFDVNLHPEMIIALFELFIQPETNPHNAQLLFSTHCHIVLNKLDKYQIILVEKNKNEASEAWRLNQVVGVRSDENYYMKYITGAYGAIPNIQ